MAAAGRVATGRIPAGQLEPIAAARNCILSVKMLAALHANRKYVVSNSPRLKEDLDCVVLMSLGVLRYRALRTLQRGGLDSDGLAVARRAL